MKDHDIDKTSKQRFVIKTKQGEAEISWPHNQQPGFCPNCHKCIPFNSIVFKKQSKEYTEKCPYCHEPIPVREVILKMTSDQERLFTIGELARICNVTVRTLQYYDEQDLLKPMITESGRRKYTREAVLRLEQILFLKSLGFSLEEINEKILDLNTSADLEKIFTLQRNALTEQIKHLNNMVNMLDTVIIETRANQEINMDHLIAIMECMKRGSPYAFVVRYFNDEQLKSFATQLYTMSGEMNVKEVFDNLKELYEKGVSPEGKEGQQLAERWWSMVNEFSSGDSELLKALINAGLDIQNWPVETKDIQEPIKNFLAKALNVYIRNHNIQIGIENISNADRE